LLDAYTTEGVSINNSIKAKLIAMLYLFILFS
jgi:hypothetical protein